MRIETFTDSFPVAAPPESVHAHLAEPTNHIGLSPLIVAVRDIRRESREVLRYVAVERFRLLGPLRYDNRLRVTQTDTVPGRQLVMEVRSSARVRVRFVFDVAPAPAGSVVTVTATLRMPTLLRGYVLRTARRVQAFRARALAERMAGAVD
ncbi:Polyketide cyclase / dehydrase and lipid transport [Micromonospora pattaloongensis]|uniref:Polyketide cyclase / dehydrase and lipid transport n=1 Tax=Micromonospora pattaloongensis TaxID=405436 RepID=A0A1H3FY82_9ACTN|nr:SRPBCC family protein [Micromonospora pattaloongensis]SDX95805.1 Polyketide cyclase / dehydrase and lipid transport [Micromonospora pattaloongensis]